ncbi:MAG: hypothetical protein CMD65_04475 [Gammaproteobacteria bacterium]|nr:hypothetical protein [Gammaproteobacteria bacterium]
MRNILIICFLVFSIDGLCKPVQIQYSSGEILNGFHYTNTESKSIAIILHGTRGHQNLELITSLGATLLENNIDSLSINLSYGITNRKNDFLPCDINHKHLQSKSIHEIKYWFNYIKKLNYEKIYLIGHSRGGLNMMQFYKGLNKADSSLIHAIFLIAPISDDFHDTRTIMMEKNKIDIQDLISQETGIIQIDFLNCANASVNRKTFLDYYNLDSNNIDNSKKPLISLLQTTTKQTYIITASEDIFVPNTYSRLKQHLPSKKNIELFLIDDADHFFRDFYFDDLIEILLNLMK